MHEPSTHYRAEHRILADSIGVQESGGSHPARFRRALSLSHNDDVPGEIIPMIIAMPNAGDERRVFRAAFDIASSFALDLDATIILARRLTKEAFDFAATEPVGE